jgi:hypothetical protein
MSASFIGLAQIIGGVLGGGVLVALINAWTGRRKSKADAESISIATANALMDGMRRDIADLRGRVQHQDQVITAYGKRVDYLTRLLLRSGVDVEDWSLPS